MISSAQIRAARALLGMDQRALAKVSGLSLPTIQRMESSEGQQVRGNVDSLVKLMKALENNGVKILLEGEKSLEGGSGVRLINTIKLKP